MHVLTVLSVILCVCVCSCVMIVWIMQRDCFKWIFKVRLVSLTQPKIPQITFHSPQHAMAHFIFSAFPSPLFFLFFFCLLDAAFAYPPSCAICIFPAFFCCTLASSKGRGKNEWGGYILFSINIFPRGEIKKCII